MSVKTEKVSAAQKIKPEEKVVNFQPEQLKAPFSLRCGALLVDYIIFIAVPVVGLLLARSFGEDGRKLLDSRMNGAGWMIAFLVALSNFIIFPMLSGQTIGKMLTGLRVVKMDGTIPGLGALVLRHLIGYPLIILTGGLGFLIAIINSKGRALDDFVSGTMVIHGKRKVAEIKN